jgi:hypothetical protein
MRNGGMNNLLRESFQKLRIRRVGEIELEPLYTR